jgi:hypothetical protein
LACTAVLDAIPQFVNTSYCPNGQFGLCITRTVRRVAQVWVASKRNIPRASKRKSKKVTKGNKIKKKKRSSRTFSSCIPIGSKVNHLI